MKKCLFLVLTAFLIYSCNDEKIKFNEEHIQEETGNCAESSCATLDISYLVCEGNASFAENFNKEITSDIISFIYNNEDDTQPETIEQAITLYFQDFTNTHDNFSVAGYELIIADTITYQSDRMICLKSERYSFMGGAHGLSQTLYYNFEVPTGFLIPNEKLFTDKNTVTEIAEKYFRKENNIQPGESYDRAGFWFENGFQLPENIGFTEDKMVLYYNPYEIAPYAMGAISIQIPISEIKQWLTFFK